MIRSRAWTDTRGTTAVELALTLPAFLALLFGGFEYGTLMWTQLSLQHGVEMAARCAVITPGICSSNSATQSYAASQAYGLNPPVSTFAVTTPACGEEISASYKFSFATSYFGAPVTLSASSCFPK
jgi:Flp pilus assembly protein TadG